MRLNWTPALQGRSLLQMSDLSDAEMASLIDLSLALKNRRDGGTRGDLLNRKQIALIFEKSSTRTRNAASCAIRDEGGATEYLSRNDIHLGSKESVADTARVLGRMFDGILFRGYSQKTVETLARCSGVPVWNGLTEEAHPTQILADLMTLKQKFGTLKGLKLAYVGDGRNNVANSLMTGCAKAGMNYVVCAPPELTPDAARVAEARAAAAANGSTVAVAADPVAGVKGANVIYTDVWVSMGEEDQKMKRLSLLRPYQVNAELVRATGVPASEFVFLHCLPAFHDAETDMTRDCGALEVTNEVFEAPYSKVFDEAENRMHTMKALFISALT